LGIGSNTISVANASSAGNRQSRRSGCSSAAAKVIRSGVIAPGETEQFPLRAGEPTLLDIYATAGIRTTSHSKICENLVPNEDATTVTKLYQAGGVLLRKLATHEFAHGGPSFEHV
jgi:aspartyl-tRNA(Asn)/glutamyl-tRNA(Gln) amidotransferase subunit A